MELTLRPGFTVGVAALSAATIALAPVTPPAVPEVQLPAVQLTGVFDGVIDDIAAINGSLATVSPLLGGYGVGPPWGNLPLPIPAWLTPMPTSVPVPGYFTVGADLVTNPLGMVDYWLDKTAPEVANALQQAVVDLVNPAAELAHIGTALSNVGNELFSTASGLVFAPLFTAGQEAALVALALDGNPLDLLNGLALLPAPLLELPLQLVYMVVDDVVNNLPYAIASAF